MTPELMRAATALSDALARENLALAAVDFVAAASMLDAKRAAAGHFAIAHARQVASGGNNPGAAPREIAAIARRLSELATENKTLLERAIAAQRRVIGSIAKAAPKAMARAPRYDRKGTLTDARSPVPVALSSRA
jgi:hypothetical protein